MWDCQLHDYIDFKYHFNTFNMMLTHHHPLMILLLLTLSHLSTPLLVERKQPLAIEIQLGRVYNKTIPSLFDNFQYTSLRQFQNPQAKIDVPICRVAVSSEGTLSRHSLVSYNQYDSQRWLHKQVVSTFEDLKRLKHLRDAIYFKSKLFGLFRSNQLLIYELDSTKGTLAQSLQLTIDYPEIIEDGRFIVVNDELLILSSHAAFKIQPDANVRKLQGYNGTKTQIKDVQVANSMVYVGLGEQGLQSYQYLHQNNSLLLMKQIEFSFKSIEEQARIKVDQLQIDPTGSYIYILDYIEGLLEIPMIQLKQFKQIYSSNAKLLVSHCQNLVVLSLSLFVTCPQLIQIDRQTGKVNRMLHNTFYPYNMQHIDQRLYLYGRQSFAVYDLFGKVLDEYSLTAYSDFSIKVQTYLITFSRVGVISEQIQPQKQQLFCFGNQDNQVGKYIGLLYTQGICKEYTGTAKIDKNNQICYIQQPFEINVKDPSSLDLTIELYLVGAWLLFSCLFGTTMAIKHIIVRRKYKPLIEEDIKDLQQVSHSIISNQKGGKTEEVQEPV